MALRVISLILSVTIALGASAGYAQENTIQSSLFENCEEAREKFSNLSPEERTKLVDYLTRVVGLNTRALAAPEVFAVLPGGKGIEPNPPALWQNMDAKRELRGKRCALELLTLAGPLAFPAVPQIATLYSEQALSDEIAVGIEETAATIAEQAHRNGQAPTDEVMDKLIVYLTSERPLVTRNFLHEYLSLSLPRVLTYLSTLSQDDATKVVAFLRDADPAGSRSMRTFVELVPKLTVENADRLASYLPFPSKEGVAPLVNDFARLAAEPTNGPHVTSLLSKSCVILGGILIDPTLATTLGRNPSILRTSALSESEQRCLASSVPSLANSLLSLMMSSQESDPQQALSLLSSAFPLMDTERKNALFIKVKELALQPSSKLRPEALTALSLFTERRSDAHAILLNALKSSLAGKRDTSVDAVVNASCQSAVVLNTSKEINRYSALVMEAIKKGIPFYFVTELQITRGRWYWFEEKLIQTNKNIRLSYQPLTQQYRISTEGFTYSANSISDALIQIGAIGGWQVADLAVLENGQTYQGAMRMRLDLTKLPKPFQINALNTRDWTVLSDWHPFTITPKARATK